jgi:hypothetical protein
MQSRRVGSISNLSLQQLTTRHSYDIAEFYLSQVDYDLEIAVLSYKDDEKWEKEHPLKKGKGRRNRPMVGNSAMSTPVRW